MTSPEVAEVDDLSVVRMQRALSTQHMGRFLHLFRQVSSTSDLAREALSRGAPRGATFIANCQTAGRGAHQRDWSSPPGTDLYLSIVERSTLPPANLPLITLSVGLAVAKAAERFLGGSAKAAIKWPNDVYIRGKKVAGILVESSSRMPKGACVIGIGINVNRERFPSALAQTATSLRAQLPNNDVDRSEVAAAVLTQAEKALVELELHGAHRLVCRVGHRLCWRGCQTLCGVEKGIFLGVHSSGGARLVTASGIQCLHSGPLRLG